MPFAYLCPALELRLYKHHDFAEDDDDHGPTYTNLNDDQLARPSPWILPARFSSWSRCSEAQQLGPDLSEHHSEVQAGYALRRSNGLDGVSNHSSTFNYIIVIAVTVTSDGPVTGRLAT